jgi:Fe-S-cluster-containing dehydrogenase component
MGKYLIVDMTKCDECETCTVQCAYLYQPSVTDHGMKALREQVAFLLTCRRCEEPSCVAACRFEALERKSDNVITRHNMRCVSCKCCSHACPFGTIYPELVPFYAVRCDFCMSALKKGDFACLSSCAKKAVEYREIPESEMKSVHILSDNLAVKAPVWVKKEA